MSVKVILIGPEVLTNIDGNPFRPCGWATGCALCGSEVMAAMTPAGGVWDGDSAYCRECGAVDSWCVDQDHAHLQGLPEEEEVAVLRTVFSTKVWDDVAAELGFTWHLDPTPSVD